MKKIFLTVFVLMGIFMFSLFIPHLTMAHSPVKVNKIIVSPVPFKAGNTVSISVEIENTARSNYGCVGTELFKVFLSIWKSDVVPGNYLWSTSQPLTAVLGPGEKRTIAFSANWTVPNIDPDKFIFHASGPLCPPDKYREGAELSFLRSCSYSPIAPMEYIRIRKIDIGK